MKIVGTEAADSIDGVKLCDAGTVLAGAGIVRCSGGQVLAVTGMHR